MEVQPFEQTSWQLLLHIYAHDPVQFPPQYPVQLALHAPVKLVLHSPLHVVLHVPVQLPLQPLAWASGTADSNASPKPSVAQPANIPFPSLGNDSRRVTPCASDEVRLFSVESRSFIATSPGSAAHRTRMRAFPDWKRFWPGLFKLIVPFADAGAKFFSTPMAQASAEKL